MNRVRHCQVYRALGLALVLVMPNSCHLGRAEEPATQSKNDDSGGEAARRLGRRLLGTGGGQLHFDGPIKIEKDENGFPNALFCVRNAGLEPKRVTVFAGSSRSDLGVLDPGERKCSNVDVSGLSGHPAAQLRIQERGPW